MTDESEQLPVIDSWDTYWQGAQSSAAYSGGGTTHPLVLTFWDDYFHNFLGREALPRIIDIASGNGAVVESASKAFTGALPDFTCLDVSASAIRMIEERFPGVHGVVADAAEIPLDSASFDIATSQFGVEYAGLEALDEVARLIARRGELALLLHHRGGVIFQECSASFDAIRDMQAANFIPLCIAVFETGFAAMQGGDRAAYGAAGRQFAPAIQAMEAIMGRYGRDVAAGTILRVYRDVRTIHERMRNYEPPSVIGWLEKMQVAIEAYAGRMSSMCACAIGEQEFAEVTAGLAQKGFEMLRAEPLAHSDQDAPIAWALIARKG